MNTYIIAHKTHRQSHADITYVVADTEKAALAVFDKRYGEQITLYVKGDYAYKPFGEIKEYFPEGVTKDNATQYAVLEVLEDGYVSVHKFYTTCSLITEDLINLAYPNSKVQCVTLVSKEDFNLKTFLEPNIIEIYSPEYIEYYGITDPEILNYHDNTDSEEKPSKSSVIKSGRLKSVPYSANMKISLESDASEVYIRKSEDIVNNPKHYKLAGKEVLDIIRDQLTDEQFKGYLTGNILKYRLRAGKKGDALTDIAKANFYENLLTDLITEKE